jgi:hypothetical protein
VSTAAERAAFTWKWKATIVWIAFCVTVLFVRVMLIWAGVWEL